MYSRGTTNKTNGGSKNEKTKYLLTPEKKKAFVENAYIAKTISELKRIEKLSHEQAVKIMEIIDVN